MQFSNESVGDLSFIFRILIIIYFKILAILTLMLDLYRSTSYMCMLYACLSIPFIEHDGSNANSTIVDLYIHNHIIVFVNKCQMAVTQ